MLRLFVREALLMALLLLLTTAAVFAALDLTWHPDWFGTAAIARSARFDPRHGSTDTLRLLWNPDVADARVRTLRDLDALSRSSERMDAAARLAHRGSAALPTVMARLPHLAPEVRVAALRALATMAPGLTGGERAPEPTGLEDTPAALLWWDRFYSARLLDFRPGYATRQVERLVAHDSRNASERVTRLGTYALPALIEALTPLPGRESVARVTEALSLHAGLVMRVAPDASTADTARVAEAWRAWWFATHLEYETLSSWQRALGRVTETRYGSWLTRALRGRFGISRATGRPVSVELRERLPMSTFTSGLGGLLAVASIVAFGGGPAMRRRPLRTKMLDLAGALIPGLAAFLLVWALVLRACAPSGGAGALATSLFDGIGVLKATLSTAACATLAALWVRRPTYRVILHAVRIEAEQWASESLNPTGWQVLRHGARIGAASLLAPLGVAAPAVLLASLIVELLFGLRGMGALSTRALVPLDAPWVMAAVVTLVPLLLGRRWALGLLIWLLGVRTDRPPLERLVGAPKESEGP
jgi:peptide/nickel transport system permease protein